MLEHPSFQDVAALCLEIEGSKKVLLAKQRWRPRLGDGLLVFGDESAEPTTEIDILEGPLKRQRKPALEDAEVDWYSGVLPTQFRGPAAASKRLRDKASGEPGDAASACFTDELPLFCSSEVGRFS